MFGLWESFTRAIGGFFNRFSFWKKEEDWVETYNQDIEVSDLSKDFMDLNNTSK